jgi:hypothetical protein
MSEAYAVKINNAILQNKSDAIRNSSSEKLFATGARKHSQRPVDR